MTEQFVATSPSRVLSYYAWHTLDDVSPPQAGRGAGINQARNNLIQKDQLMAKDDGFGELKGASD